MKRLFDLILSTIFIIVFSVPMLFIIFTIRLTSKGPALYWSDRIGFNNSIYRMPKFRSMRTDTPQVATHLMSNPDKFLSPIGGFLRQTSLDELPQLFSILKGDMSFVGPRPALFNQNDFFCIYSTSSITFSGIDNSSRPLTCAQPVNPGKSLSKPFLDLKIIRSSWL